MLSRLIDTLTASDERTPLAIRRGTAAHRPNHRRGTKKG
ncbi:hypothetical protein H180DRAFT_02501 [Streptomyces sp. WMMB 322]|nr:hypothetical protein H180DRAFT_02501 [Streptomyces sp. WMMB 322]